MPWALLAKFWWIAPLAALLGWVAILTVERDRARANYATAQGTIASIQAEARVAAEQAKARESSNTASLMSLEAKLNATQSDRDTLSTTLAQRLHDIRAARNACASAKDQPVATGPSAPGGVAPEASEAGRINAAMGSLETAIAAAQDDANSACRNDGPRLNTVIASWPK
jgi:chromosome segregation ATPase